MRSRTEGSRGMPLYRPPWGRSRPHLSLREGSEPPPFPSRFIVSDRSSPSRVRFAASRPGRLRADPKDALLTRGKGGTAGRESTPGRLRTYLVISISHGLAASEGRSWLPVRSRAAA